MKALVAYYSRGGTTKKVAEKISALLEGDIEEIHDLKKRSGIIGWFKSRAPQVALGVNHSMKWSRCAEKSQ